MPASSESTQGDGHNAVALFSLAVAMEHTLAWIYKTAAGLVTEESAEQALTRLSAVEEQHARQLAETWPHLAASMEDDDSPSAWTISRVHREFIPQLDLDDTKSLLLAAFRTEKGGEDFYRRMAAASTDARSRDLASYMEQQEILHQTAIARVYQQAFDADIHDDERSRSPIPWPEVSLE